MLSSRLLYQQQQQQKLVANMTLSFFSSNFPYRASRNKIKSHNNPIQTFQNCDKKHTPKKKQPASSVSGKKTWSCQFCTSIHLLRSWTSCHQRSISLNFLTPFFPTFLLSAPVCWCQQSPVFQIKEVVASGNDKVMSSRRLAGWDGGCD